MYKHKHVVFSTLKFLKDVIQQSGYSVTGVDNYRILYRIAIDEHFRTSHFFYVTTKFRVREHM